MNKFDKNNIDIEKLFTYLLLLAVYAISIKEMYGIHYTTADDVVAELYQNYFTLNEAIEKGFRITYILNNYLFANNFNLYSFLLKSNEYVIFIIKTSIISTHIILFLSIISKIIKNNTIAPILTLLCFFSLQNYWEHHLISAFPIIGINTTILLISIRLFLSDNKITYYFSGVLFLASCLIYELFLSFYPLYIIFAFNRKTHFKRDFCYISSIAALFTLSYFGFSTFSKITYTGASIVDYNLNDIFRTIYIYSTSNIPGMMILKTKSTISQIMFGNINYEINLNDYFDLIKFEWIVKILLISTILFITMGKSYTIHFSKRQLLILLAISICLIVLPNIPVSLVELHRDNALYRGTTVYTGSYFSGYGYALLFFVIILTIMSRKLFVLRYRIFLLSVLIVLFSIISTNVDISNHYVKYAQAGDMRLWQVVDKLLINNYDYVKGKMICAPSLWERGLRFGLFHPRSMGSYWNDYAKNKFNKIVTITKNNCNYYIKFLDNYKSGDYFLLISKIENGKLTKLKLLDYNGKTRDLIFEKYDLITDQFKGNQVVSLEEYTNPFDIKLDPAYYALPSGYYLVPRKVLKNKINEIIDFSSNKINPYLFTGWHYSEGWGRWTNSEKASLLLPFIINSRILINIKYNKNPIFREGDTFTVCVNHSCNQYDYSEKDLNIVYVPKNDSERVVVTFQTHVISPPGSSDLRNLGIGIKSITIQKIE